MRSTIALLMLCCASIGKLAGADMNYEQSIGPVLDKASVEEIPEDAVLISRCKQMIRDQGKVFKLIRWTVGPSDRDVATAITAYYQSVPFSGEFKEGSWFDR